MKGSIDLELSLAKNLLRFWRSPVSLCFALGCLIASIRIQFHPELYRILSSNVGGSEGPVQTITSIFVHGGPGDVLFGLGVHLLGNLSVIALFGNLLERLLGPGRFFLLSGATFLTQWVFKLIAGGGNGASGVCWAYGLIAIPVLLWTWQEQRGRMLQDPAVLAMIALVGLMLIGLPVLLWIMGLGFWNMTNLAHVLSMATGIPVLVLWRRVLVENWRRLRTGLAPRGVGKLPDAAAAGAGLLLLVFVLLTEVSAAF